MRLFILFIFTCIFTLKINISLAQSISSVIVNQFGANGTESTYDIVVGPDGSLYISGHTSGSWASHHTVVEPYVFGTDVFLAKLDPTTYAVDWVSHLGSVPSGSSYDYAYAMQVDANDNIYVTGYTGSTFTNQNALSTEGDGYIAKYNSSGQLQWLRQEGSATNGSFYGIGIDDSGNIYAAGYATGSVNGQTAFGDYDIVVIKLDANGNEIWTSQYGSTTDDQIRGAKLKGNYFYIVGQTLGSIDGETNAGDYDGFLAKYDLNGNRIWHKQFGTTLNESLQTIDIDDSGNVYIGGFTDGTLQGTSAGQNDAFIAKYDENGNEIWIQQFGTNKDDDLRHIIISDDGTRIYGTGRTKGNIDGSSAADTHGDYYLVWYDNSGNQEGILQYGTGLVEFANGLDVANGKIYIGGSTNTNLVAGQHLGNFDAFIHEFVDSDFLGVELIEFTAHTQQESVHLSWATAVEENNECFTIQRSPNGFEWENIGVVAGIGTTIEKHSYSFVDKTPLKGTSYYRLQQSDFDGSVSYSNIESILLSTAKIANIYPNPATDHLIVEHMNLTDNNFAIYDILGQKMNINSNFISGSSQQIIDIQHLPTGQYILITDDITKRFSVK